MLPVVICFVVGAVAGFITGLFVEKRNHKVIDPVASKV